MKKKRQRTYYPRSAWTNRQVALSAMSTPKHPIYIHHTADIGPPGGRNATPGNEQEYMRTIESFHINSRDMRAVAYSFIVMPSGRVYEGRGWGKIGAHTENHNDDGHAICFAGNFESQRPTDEAMRAALALIRRGVRRRKVSKVWTILGHRDTKATACPGKNLYARLRELKP